MWISVVVVSTLSPSATPIAVTIPSFGLRILFSIFMASTISSRSPVRTADPVATAILITLPGMGAETVPAVVAAAGEGGTVLAAICSMSFRLMV